MRFAKYIFFIAILVVSNITFAEISQAPAINLPALNGGLDLAKLRGKVVYLDFWASWCEPCKKSFPWMNEMQATYKDQGLEVVAVNLDKDRQLADAFLEKVKVNFIVAFDKAGDAALAYKLRGMPSSYLIGRDGQIYASHIGFREKDKSKMEQAIKRLLQQ